MLKNVIKCLMAKAIGSDGISLKAALEIYDVICNKFNLDKTSEQTLEKIAFAINKGHFKFINGKFIAYCNGFFDTAWIYDTYQKKYFSPLTNKKAEFFINMFYKQK